MSDQRLPDEGPVTLIQPEAAPHDAFRGPEFERGLANNVKREDPDFLNSAICTVCGKEVTFSLTLNGLLPHPALKVLMCKPCLDFYNCGEIKQDENGIDEHCQWCGEGGNLMLCDFCPKAFCNYCIKRNFSNEEFQQIRDLPNWHCFVCNKKPLESKTKACMKVMKQQNVYCNQRRQRNIQDQENSGLATFPSYLTEMNEHIDDLIGPLENQINDGTCEKTSAAKKKVTPITILRERENYVVQSNSSSGNEAAKKIKFSPSSLSEPEKNITSSNTPVNVSALSTDKGDPPAPLENENNNAEGTEYNELETDTVTPVREEDDTTTSGDDSDFSLKAMDDSESQTTGSSDTTMSGVVSGAKEKVSDDLSEMNTSEILKSESEQSRVETKQGQSKQEVILKPHENKSLFLENKVCNMEIEKKLKQAHECISTVVEMCESESSHLNDSSKTEDNLTQSPNQYFQYRTTVKFLNSIKKLQSSLTRVERALDNHKKRLGKFHNRYASQSNSESSSSDENTSDASRSTWKQYKEERLSKSHSSSSPKQQSVSSIPCEVQPPSLDNDSTNVPITSQEEPAKNDSVQKIYDAKVILKKLTENDIMKFSKRRSEMESESDVAEPDDDTDSSKAEFRLKRNQSSSSDSSEGLDEFKTRMKRKSKLTSCAETQSNVQGDEGKDVDFGGKSKSKIQEKKKGKEVQSTKEQEESSTDFDVIESSLKKDSPDKLKANRTKKENVNGKGKSKMREKEKESIEEHGESSMDSDATEFSLEQESPDKLKFNQTKQENDIALDQILKRIGEEKQKSDDSDVDDLISKKDKNANKKTKSESGDAGSEKEKMKDDDSNGIEDVDEKTSKSKSKYRHPLLNLKVKIFDDEEKKEEINETENKEGKNKRKHGNVDEDTPVLKKAKKKLNLDDDDALSSAPENSSDSDDESSPDSKKIRMSQRKSKKVLKIDSEESDPAEDAKSNDEVRGAVNLIDDVDESDDTIISKSDLDDSEKEEKEFDTSRRKSSYSVKKKRRRVIDPDSEPEEEQEREPDITDSEQKRGRRNIRKILNEGGLSESTIQASQEEQARRRRLEENRDLEEESAEVIVIDDETQSPKKKVITLLKLSKDPLVEVNEGLVEVLKPHQVNGIRFMWDNVIESVKDAKQKPGGGCILAHCMGLGKTLQAVAFLHTVLTCPHLPHLRTVLVICPYGTVNNWVHEFKKWLKKCNGYSKSKMLLLFELNSVKSNSERASTLERWKKRGGVMIMGYGLYRTLMDENKRHLRHQKTVFLECLQSPGPDILICDEGHILKNSNSRIAQVVNRMDTRRRIILTGTPLQNNMVEYHCMVSIVKPRLLGNLKEYKNRFTNPIENGQHIDSTARDVKLMKKRAHVLHELLAGCVQRKDYSCLRSHLSPKYEYVLSVRMSDLQIHMYQQYLTMHSSADVKLRKACLFTDFNTLLLLVCHPRCLVLAKERREQKQDTVDDIQKFINDGDLDEDEGETSDGSIVVISDDSEAEEKRNPKPTTEEDLDVMSRRRLKNFIKKQSGKEVGTNNRKELVNLATKYLEKNFCNTTEFEESLKVKSVQELKKIIMESGGQTTGCTEKSDLVCRIKMLKQSQVDEEWFEKLMPTQDNLVRCNVHGGKIVLMLEILHEAMKMGDKVVLFSQSLLTLNLIEEVLKTETEEVIKGFLPKLEPYSKWFKGIDYFRLDGSIPVKLRDEWIGQFNNPKHLRGRLFLISTRAGGIGINLIGANRAIVFDASWNPTHDIQSIFRIYRFGQKKACYIYRFIAQGTMEEKIYERQIMKESLAFRVVDEQQIIRHFSAADISELYKFKPAPKPIRRRGPDGKEIVEDTPKCAPPKDSVLASIIKSNSTRDVIVSYHEHDSLLDHQVSEELSEAERRAAWEEYDYERSLVENREINKNSFLGTLNPATLLALRKKAEEALNMLNQKLARIQEKSISQLMQTFQLKDRTMTTKAAMTHAVNFKLDQHLMLRRLNKLKKFIAKKKNEIEYCYGSKYVQPNVFPGTAPNVMRPTQPANRFPSYPQPLNNPMRQNHPRMNQPHGNFRTFAEGRPRNPQTGQYTRHWRPNMNVPNSHTMNGGVRSNTASMGGNRPRYPDLRHQKSAHEMKFQG